MLCKILAFVYAVSNTLVTKQIDQLQVWKEGTLIFQRFMILSLTLADVDVKQDMILEW